jgi:CDP-glycerol glycerophosphotransferase (TagB/SpsB family)
MKKSIFISAPYGLQIHDLLYSDILPYLLKNSDFQIIVLTFPHKKGILANQIAMWNGRVAFEDLFLNPLKYKKHLIDRIHGIRRSKWVSRSKFFTLATNTLNASFYREQRYRNLFRKYNPSLVITSTPGQNLIDRFLLHEANKAKISTLSIVESWDKLITKGPMHVRPHFLAVWNEMMKEEAIFIHYYDPRKIFVVGTTRFDSYLKDRKNMHSKGELYKLFKMDPHRKLITLTTAPTPSVGDHNFILRILIENLNKNRFSHPVQILCRLHPNDDYRRYKDFRGTPHLYFDIPNFDLRPEYWLPSREDFSHLAALVTHTDVLVNIASTMTIEAAIADTPIVNLGFSTSEPDRFAYQVGVVHHQKHYRHILERKGVRIACTEKELIAFINKYLENPSLDRDGRRQIANDLTYKTDGMASKRIAGLIAKLLK